LHRPPHEGVRKLKRRGVASEVEANHVRKEHRYKAKNWETSTRKWEGKGAGGYADARRVGKKEHNPYKERGSHRITLGGLLQGEDPSNCGELWKGRVGMWNGRSTKRMVHDRAQKALTKEKN